MQAQYAIETANPADYSVFKDGNKWGLLCNGLPVQGKTYLGRKKDALASIPAVTAYAAYKARTQAEDETGHVWTDDERDQIAKYAEALKDNKERFTLTGYRTLQDEGRRDHFQEINTITSHYAWGEPGEWSKQVCAEIRRRRAARTEAYMLAGEFLDENYYQLTIKGLHNPHKIRPAHVYTYATRAEAEASIENTLRIIKKENSDERYEFTIETITPVWPIVCKFVR